MNLITHVKVSCFQIDETILLTRITTTSTYTVFTKLFNYVGTVISDIKYCILHIGVATNIGMTILFVNYLNEYC